MADQEFSLGMPMDENEMYTAGVEIVSYLDGMGNNCFRLRYDTTVPPSTILGLIELGKFQILQNSNNPG